MPTPRKYNSDAERAAAYRERKKQAHAEALKAKGLPALPSIPTMPGAARWKAAIEQARALLEQTRDEMQGYHDERSDEWRESERGEIMQERIEGLEDVIAVLEMLEG